MQQQGVYCEFSNGNSWIILSPIEQSIKRKMEAIGTPLKDWDIQINYGIKTGFNDAFIITTEKRDEILANCQTEEERIRTDELIRPLLIHQARVKTKSFRCCHVALLPMKLPTNLISAKILLIR